MPKKPTKAAGGRVPPRGEPPASDGKGKTISEALDKASGGRVPARRGPSARKKPGSK